ncbi:CD248 molecule, endosialin a precursor [Silurus meridionalis]|nr:CD248 molecule, endosialin a precursor [Silurus meridionalis]
MGSTVLYVILLSVLLYISSMQTQELQEQDAICNESSCIVIYLQRKTFLNAWRSCKTQGGNLVTIKSSEDVNLIETLFSNQMLMESRHLFLWIGLQRQPRKCAASHPMRGFSWITGEQNTQYTNWLQEDSPSTCMAQRCVGIGYSPSEKNSPDNFKWKDGSCSIPVDGYLCRYTFSGMCQAISNEGYGNALYTTPFDLVTSLLTHIPFGTIATVPCLTKGDQTVLCTHREDKTTGWNIDPPFCSDIPKTRWCERDNGGCDHYCIEDDTHYYCDCKEGFILAEDSISCFQTDPCHESPCEYECLAVMDSYRCACPEGYMLAPDEQGCLDVNECLQSPCEQICVNAPGTFECRCREGYKADEVGTCEDVDECTADPCEHDCENVIGSYICHCHHGFAALPGDPSHCFDIDECQVEGICEQMCINSFGGFECYCEEGFDLQNDFYSCKPIYEPQSSTVPSILLITDFTNRMEENHDPDYYKPKENESLDWLTDTSNVEMVPTDLLWPNGANQEVTLPTESPTSMITETETDNADQQTVAMDTFLSSTTSTLSEYYEEKSTTEFIVFPTTTVAGGASIPSDPDNEKIKTHSPYTTDTDDENLLDNGSHDYESTTSYNELQTFTQAYLSTQEDKNTSSVEQSQGSSWLLVGLLVPLCIFIVVMVALGIIYCTRCTSKPQNKNATECYHWIPGAGDKAVSDLASGGVTKV